MIKTENELKTEILEYSHKVKIQIRFIIFMFKIYNRFNNSNGSNNDNNGIAIVFQNIFDNNKTKQVETIKTKIELKSEILEYKQSFVIVGTKQNLWDKDGKINLCAI